MNAFARAAASVTARATETQVSDMTPSTFKAIRERTGHTQASLAAFARITTRQVQMIEAGDRKPGGPLIVLMELLDAGKI